MMILDVVEPTSIPKNTLPLYFLSVLFLVICVKCLSLNSFNSASSLNNGSKTFVSSVGESERPSKSSIILEMFNGFSTFSFAFKHAPIATNSCEFCGKMISSSVKPNVSIKRSLN